jgi:hypothetical protein
VCIAGLAGELCVADTEGEDVCEAPELDELVCVEGELVVCCAKSAGETKTRTAARDERAKPM